MFRTLRAAERAPARHLLFINMSHSARLALILALLPATATAQAPREDGALDHASRYAATRGVAADLVTTDAHVDSRGTSYVYLRQAVAGIEVVGSEVSIGMDASGRVFHAAGLERVEQAPAGAVATAVVSATDAAAALARHNGLGSGLFSVVDYGGGAEQRATLSEGGVALEPVQARLVWHRGDGRGLRLAWEVQLYQLDALHCWLGYVDAQTGEVIAQMDLVVHDTFGAAAEAPAQLAPWLTDPQHLPSLAGAMVGSYRVFPMPVEAPIYAAVTPPSDGRTTVANPDNAAASPFGWHDTNGAAGAEFTVTRGNNVHAYTDVDANNSPDTNGSPSGGTSLAFSFPLDLTQPPSAYRPAAVTNLFYWNNIIHDVMHHYGFTPAAGNFQVNNYGGGGSGNDDVRAEAQDGSGTNNANFFTPADGSRPRMQMYIGTSPNPDVDGDFDNGVIVHEYGHGISNRLTGGRTNVSCLGNAEQAGEGWSDWYGLMFTMEAGDSGGQSRGIGNYLFGQGPTGGGIRPAPYSTNFTVNNYTYQRTRTLAVPHGVGFVWATILWELTWDMINAHGFSADIYNASGTAGNQMMMNLVTTGLKLQPCSPGFVSARDAILAADQNLYGGVHLPLLQAAFARRGLGYSATQGSTNSNGDNTEAFNLWPTAGNQPPNAAFSVSCSGLTCNFTDTSTDSDGTIQSRAWAFGDGTTSTATNPSKAYAAGGTYAVTLTVTDDDGATDNASQNVTVSGGGGGSMVLSVALRMTGPWVNHDLTWTGSDGGQARIFRNGAVLTTTADDGSHSYRVGRNVSGTDTYRVCDVEDGVCSNEATIAYLDGGETSLTLPVELGVRVAPNPAVGATHLRFGLPTATDVELVVYNAVGQRMAVLASGAFSEGYHDAALDASALPAGVYVYRLRAGGEEITGRFLVAR